MWRDNICTSEAPFGAKKGLCEILFNSGLNLFSLNLKLDLIDSKSSRKHQIWFFYSSGTFLPLNVSHNDDGVSHTDPLYSLDLMHRLEMVFSCKSEIILTLWSAAVRLWGYYRTVTARLGARTRQSTSGLAQNRPPKMSRYQTLCNGLETIK